MSRARSIFTCQQCGAQFAKWVGRCTECGTWESVVEEATPSRAPAASARTSIAVGAVRDARPQSIASVKSQRHARTGTGLAELDRVLGGGIVAGSVILLGGDPGIGKSTLLLQACARLAPTVPVLYVTGEESPQQVALRARRLGVEGGGLGLLAETNVERILAA